MNEALHTWLNAACLMVIAGAAAYATLIPYITRDK